MSVMRIDFIRQSHFYQNFILHEIINRKKIFTEFTIDALMKLSELEYHC